MIDSSRLTVAVRIWLANAPVDMRRSFDALAEQVRTILAGDPMSGHLFVFRSRSGQRVKILWWDGDGLCLFAKRLERGRFIWPKAESGAVRLSRAPRYILCNSGRTNAVT